MYFIHITISWFRILQTQIKNHPYFSQLICCVLLLIVLSTTENMFHCYMCSILYCFKGKRKGRLSLVFACFCTYSFIKWIVVERGVDCGEWWKLFVFKIDSIFYGTYCNFYKNLFFDHFCDFWSLMFDTKRWNALFFTIFPEKVSLKGIVFFMLCLLLGNILLYSSLFFSPLERAARAVVVNSVLCALSFISLIGSRSENKSMIYRLFMLDIFTL